MSSIYAKLIGADKLDTCKQVILWPHEHKTGNIIYPYAKAKK